MIDHMSEVFAARDQILQGMAGEIDYERHANATMEAVAKVRAGLKKDPVT